MPRAREHLVRRRCVLCYLFSFARSEERATRPSDDDHHLCRLRPKPQQQQQQQQRTQKREWDPVGEKKGGKISSIFCLGVFCTPFFFYQREPPPTPTPPTFFFARKKNQSSTTKRRPGDQRTTNEARGRRRRQTPRPFPLFSFFSLKKTSRRSSDVFGVLRRTIYTDIIIIVTLIATTDFDPIVRERRTVTECGGVSPNSAVGDASPNGSTGATSPGSPANSVGRRFDGSAKRNTPAGGTNGAPFGVHKKTGSFGGNKVADPIWIDDDCEVDDEFCFSGDACTPDVHVSKHKRKGEVEKFRTRKRTRKNSLDLFEREKLKSNGKWSIVCGINRRRRRICCTLPRRRLCEQNRESGAERNGEYDRE